MSEVRINSDSGKIKWGADYDIELTHNADKGLILKHTATADDKPVILTLQTGETDMAANDVMGKIEFQAPDEGTGTDAILVAAAIQAVSEGDFSSSSNATRLEFMTGSSEAATSQMTISSGGIVGIGAGVPGDLGVGLHIKTSDTGASANASGDDLVVESNTGNAGISILSANNANGGILFGDDGDDDIGQIYYEHDGNNLRFMTNTALRMTIGGSGTVGVGMAAGSQTLSVKNAGTSGNVYLYYGELAHSPDDNTSIMWYAGDTTTNRVYIYSDGDIKNHDNSYGSISDERIKQDIRDSNSQWDDIKAVKVRNFKKKDDVRQYGDKAWEQIGVVAQELEAVSPKLIRHNDPSASDITSSSEFGTLYEDGDSIPEGKKIGDVKEVKEQVKSVNYSILYMKAIKALQEAMAKIEALETSNTDLKNRVTALEG